MLYGTNEIGPIGIQCEYLSPNMYHPALGVEIEIVDTDENSAGNIVISKVLLNGKRIELYRIGDIGRLLETRCPCGASVTFEHFGRGVYDYIKLGGTTIRKEEFDRIVVLFPQYIDDYRVEVSERLIDGKLMGVVVLRAFRKRGPVTTGLCSEIARDVSSALFLTPTQTYADFVLRRLFLPLVVEYSSAPFPQKHKDIKLSRVG
jgi:phenylacetate-coenzyme A ligase PaaK-like adenylate-forming protein